MEGAPASLDVGTLPEVMDDDELADLFAELDFARSSVGDVVAHNDFQVSVLGGLWTMVNMGVGYDAYQGRVTTLNSDAFHFAVDYGFQRAARYNVSLYGEEGAFVLAKTWVEKAQFFFNLWRAQPNRLYAFSDAELRSWVPSPELEQLIERLEGRAKARALDLRNFAPVRR